MDQHDSDLICVGHILGAQGLKGWVKVFSNTSPRANIVKYSPWLVEQESGLSPFEVSGREQGKQVLAKLDNIDDRNQAESLIGSKLFIHVDQLPALGKDEYYWSDLIGMKVESLQSEPLGIVDSMIETGADDVMVLKGEQERLIPFVLEKIVKSVDLENRRMIVDWSPEY
ncbi:MAG: ribosome maturation factor RimM [Pseudomonadota bacterium]